MNLVTRLVLGGAAALALSVGWAATTRAQAPATAHTPAPGAARVSQPALSSAQRAIYGKAFEAAEAGRWEEVRRLAAQGKDPLANKVLLWLGLQQPRAGVSFEDIAAFIDANPSWPGLDALTRRAEEALVDRTDDSLVLAWFALRGPATAEGAMRYAEALLRAGDRSKAAAVVKDAWSWAGFGDKQEKIFLARYRQFLGRDDHVRRLDRLIWDGRYAEARRIMPLVDNGTRAVADARIRLATFQGGVESALRRVPDSLQNDPGLMFERVRWRRRKGLTDGALELMRGAPAQLGRPEIWWNERELLVRRAITSGRMTEAYRLARQHGMSAGAGFAEAEFVAGWIALRFLKDNSAALAHFMRLHEAARFPVTQARGAYWTARALEASGDRGSAREWYLKAARLPITYYGQLAYDRLEPSARPAWPSVPAPTQDERNAFERSELTRAVRLLAEIGAHDRVKPFLLRHVALAKTPTQHALAGELAHRLDRPDLAVSAAKRSAQTAGVMLPEQGWPVAHFVNGDVPERALVLATIRQESAFEPQAISRAGARGMMQLMPATARAVARSLGLAHNDSKLLDDPPYNVELGRTYLARLIGEHDGSYVLALAAYNAGPARVRQWIREHGDPRRPHVDAVDWVEMIPFDETRNYVQRVLENLQVYRQILGGSQLAQGLQRDLRRGAN